MQKYRCFCSGKPITFDTSTGHSRIHEPSLSLAPPFPTTCPIHSQLTSPHTARAPVSFSRLALTLSRSHLLIQYRTAQKHTNINSSAKNSISNINMPFQLRLVRGHTHSLCALVKLASAINGCLQKGGHKEDLNH